MRLLAQKFSLIPSHFSNTPDPDVRIISLDNRQTSAFWDTIQPGLRGIGDNLAELTPLQIQELKLWLK
ncbi:MAG: hypothetical protein ABII21_01510 [bacterium]